MIRREMVEKLVNEALASGTHWSAVESEVLQIVRSVVLMKAMNDKCSQILTTAKSYNNRHHDVGMATI